MKFEIVNIDEFSGEMAQIYSVMFEDDDMTLMDHFFEENAQQYKEEMKEMAKKLEAMGNSTGCRIQFFKENEGAPGDGVVAFWYKRMRLYCLRIGSACIILGGGYKPPGISAYQEDELLNAKAQQMRRLAACINKAIIDKDLKVAEDGTITTTDFIELDI